MTSAVISRLHIPMRCPYCLHRIDATLSQPRAPIPGDWLICFRCCGVAQVADCALLERRRLEDAPDDVQHALEAAAEAIALAQASRQRRHHA